MINMKKKEKIFTSNKIQEIIDNKEKQNLNNLQRKELDPKLILITDIINELDNINENNSNISIRPDLFEKIRNISVTKGGLLLNSYRREIYKKVFLLNDGLIDLYYYNASSHKTQKDEDKQMTKRSIDLKTFYNTLYSYPMEFKETPNKRTTKRDEYIIEVDVKRTIANNYFMNYEDELNNLKKSLTIFIKLFFNLNPDYGYYQGFHDVALYVYLIFYNYEHLAIQMLQRIAEFYLKDYLVEINHNNNEMSITNDKTKQDKNFHFETVFNILNSINAVNDKKFWRFIQENTESTHAVNTLPWIITMFTHDIQDLCLQLRILDYILFSHPNVVYHMASYVII